MVWTYFDPEREKAITDEIERLEDRGAAIVAAAFLEDRLAIASRGRLISDSASAVYHIGLLCEVSNCRRRGTMELANVLLSAVSLIISLVAFSVSWYNLRIADKAARNDVIAELRSWGGEVVDLLAEAGELCGPQMSQLILTDFRIRQSHVASRASALLDRGRFFFPKIDFGNFGSEKPDAFQGFRPAILDLLFLTFSIIRHIDAKPGSGDPTRRRGLIHIQRQFVSVVQAATGASAPRSLRKYEEFLRKVPVKALPREMIALAGVERHSFELKFDDTLKLPDLF